MIGGTENGDKYSGPRVSGCVWVVRRVRAEEVGRRVEKEYEEKD